MKYSELFEPEPEQWGLRGDPLLWHEMKEYFGDKETPETNGEIFHDLYTYCLHKLNTDINSKKTIFVEDFSHGGMSSGEVDLKWWWEKGFYTILNRSKHYHNYHFCYVFYKTDKTPGWNCAMLMCEEHQIEDKLKQYPNWLETRVFQGTQYEIPLPDKYPIELHAGDMQLFTSWIYSLELKKYFLPEEIIPIPESKAKYNDFIYRISLTDDPETEVEKLADSLININDDLDTEYDYDKKNGKNCFSYIPVVKINNTIKIHWKFCDCYFDVFSNMYHDLMTNKFAFIKISEWFYLKFLFWDCGNTIRFKIQDYTRYVEEPIDIEMDKEEFLKKFNNMLCELQKNLDDCKTKFKRCLRTVGKIDYSKLNFDTCKQINRNKGCIDHDEDIQRQKYKSIQFRSFPKE